MNTEFVFLDNRDSGSVYHGRHVILHTPTKIMVEFLNNDDLAADAGGCISLGFAHTSEHGVIFRYLARAIGIKTTDAGEAETDFFKNTFMKHAVKFYCSSSALKRLEAERYVTEGYLDKDTAAVDTLLAQSYQ